MRIVGCGRRIARWARLGAAAAALWGAGCGTEDFPGAPRDSGDRDVPYVTTYNFGFPVRFDPIFGADGTLQIFSGGDLLNFVSAANITQVSGRGVVTGRVFDTTNTSAADVVLAATDITGKRLGDFFYNSLGGTPDFVQTRGTVALGGFTAFNIPPGEVFIKAISGGRGGVRVVAFPDQVSLTTVSIVRVVVPIVGVTGEISDELGGPILAGDISMEVLGQFLSEAGNCNDQTPSQRSVEATRIPGQTRFRFCVASEGDYFARLTGDPSVFVTTYHSFKTDPAQIAVQQATDITQFFSIQTRAGLDRTSRAGDVTWQEATTGAIAGQVVLSDQSPRANAIVKVTDANGFDIAVPNGKVSGKGTLWYLDHRGLPIQDATATGLSGRFLIVNLPIPVGDTDRVYFSATAEQPTTGRPERFSGTAVSPIFKGAVVYQPLQVTLAPSSQAGDDTRERYFTGPVSGQVMTEDGLAAVAGARVTPLGVPLSDVPTVSQNVFLADSNGAYDVPAPIDAPTARSPLLALSRYLVRVEGPNSASGLVPTYQRLTTGAAVLETAGQFRETKQDLTVVPQQAILDALESTSQTWDSTPDPIQGTGVLYGTAVDRATGLPAEGIQVRVQPLQGGGEVPVFYFDFTGVPRPAASLGATTSDGRFVAFNVPPGTTSVDVVSPDDTGNYIADSFAGGVTVLLLQVNNAPAEMVEVSGTVEALSGPAPSVPVRLTVTGGDPLPRKTRCATGLTEREGLCYTDAKTRTGETQKERIPCSESYGPSRVDPGDGLCIVQYDSVPAAFTAGLGSQTDVVIKTAATGYLDTYTFGVTTGQRGKEGVEVGVVAAEEIDRLASTAGKRRLGGTGVIWGRTTTASLGDAGASGQIAPLTCATWTEIPEPASGPPLGCGGLGVPGAIATGSFNADAFRDLAVIDTSTSDPAVTIWLNKGSGTFARSQRIERRVSPAVCAVGADGCGIEEKPVALLVLDVDADGRSDLVVLNEGSQSISTLLGRGRGKFVFGSSRGVGQNITQPNAITSADFDRDGLPDLVITDHVSGKAVVLFGTGTATFRDDALPPAQIGNQTRAVVSGFVDRDGIPDLVFANLDSVSVMQNIGVATTLRNSAFPAGVQTDLSAIAIGDLNLDNFNDVVVTDKAPGSPRLWVFLNSASGLLPPTSIPAGQNPSGVTLIDINGDRVLDLVIINAGDGTVLYRPGDGAGDFGPQSLFTVGGRPGALVVDDVTGDGLVDAILSDPVGDQAGRRVLILPQTTQPAAGLAVAAAQADGAQVGEVVYLDDSPSGVAVGAPATGASGRFMILNIPPGPVWLRLTNGGTGSRFLQAYPDSVTNTAFQVVTGPTTTVTISGSTADAVGRPVGQVQIDFLGTARRTGSNPLVFDDLGNPTGGADYRASVEANSDYVIKLTRPNQ